MRNDLVRNSLPNVETFEHVARLRNRAWVVHVMQMGRRLSKKAGGILEAQGGSRSKE